MQEQVVHPAPPQSFSLEIPLLLPSGEQPSELQLSRWVKLLYVLTQGFRPFESLALSSYRQPISRFTTTAGSDVGVSNTAALRRVNVIRNASDGFHNSISWVFSPLIFSMIIRDAVRYSNPEYHLGFSLDNFLFPTRISDTFQTASLMQYYPTSEQWRACMMLFPLVFGLLKALSARVQFLYRNEDMSGSGQTRFSIAFSQLEHSPCDLIIRKLLINLADSAMYALLHHKNIPDAERNECFRRIKTLAELPNERWLSYYAQSALYQIIMTLQNGSHAAQNQVVITQARGILQNTQKQSGVVGFYSGYLNWLLQTNQSRLAPLYSIPVLMNFYSRTVYWMIFLGGLVQLIKLAYKKGTCNQEWSYVFALAKYVCSVCPDWQHDVNLAHMNDAAQCVQDYLDHPHNPRELSAALRRGARYTQDGAPWSLDLSETEWEGVNQLDWQLLRDGFAELSKKINLFNLTLARVRDVKVVDLAHKLSELTPRVLHSLDLSNQQLTFDVIKTLNFAPSLQQLNLAHTSLTGQSIMILSERLNSTRLTHLDLAGSHLHQSGAAALVSCFSQWSLQRLILNQVNATEDSLLTLLIGLNNTNIQELDLDEAVITSAMVIPLVNLIKNNLMRLSLANCKIEYLDLLTMAEAIGAETSLESLNLASLKLDEYVISALFRSGSNSTLTTLSLEGCDLDEFCLVELGIAIGSNILRDLSLRGTKLTGPLLNIMSSQGQLSALERFDLSGNNLVDVDWVDFANKTLHSDSANPIHLNLAESYLTDQDLISIASGFNNTTRLLSLNLSQNDFTDECASAITDLVSGAHLDALYLSENSVGDRVVFALAQALLFSPLSILGLAKTSISNAGVEALAQAIPYSALVSLDVSNTLLGDHAVRSLTKALYNNNLPLPDEAMSQFPSQDWRHYFAQTAPVDKNFLLSIANTEITDAGAQALCFAAHGYRQQGSLLQLEMSNDQLQRVDPVHCGMSSSAAHLSVNVVLGVVLAHFLYSAWSWFCSLASTPPHSNTSSSTNRAQSKDTLFQQSRKNRVQTEDNQLNLKR